MSDKVRTQVEWEQPDPADLDSSPLWRIEEINSADKHRLVHSAGVLPAVGRIPISGLIPGAQCTADTRVGRWEDGAPLFTLTCDRPSPNVYMDIDITMYIGVERISEHVKNAQYTPVDWVIDVTTDAACGVIDRVAATAGL